MSDERDTDSCALCGGRGHTRSNCPWGGKLVTLLDGTQVSTHHAAWRDECRRRFDHIVRMRAMRTRNQVLEHVAQYRMQHGDEAARRLKADWAADVQLRKETVS